MRWRQRPDDTRRAMAVMMTVMPAEARVKVTKREGSRQQKIK